MKGALILALEEFLTRLGVFDLPLMQSVQGGSLLPAMLLGFLALLLVGWLLIWRGLGGGGSGGQRGALPLSSDRFEGVLRRIILRGLEGDLHGQVGERLSQLLTQRLVRPIYRHPASGVRVRSRLITGVGDEAGRGALRDDDGALQLVVNGRIAGLGLKLEFYPQGPVIMEQLAGVQLAEPEGEGFDGAVDAPRDVPSKLLSYECFDFPLFQLNGLTVHLPALQKIITSATVAGLLSRGAGIEGLAVSPHQLLAWGCQLEAEVEGLRLTQPVLHQEGVAVAAWCLLIAGLRLNNADYLSRSLRLYDRVEADEWHERDVTEWAGLKANEAMAALSLARHSASGHGRVGDAAAMQEGASGLSDREAALYQRVTHCAVEGMRHFRRDNFPASWGKMMCKLALSNGAMSAGRYGRGEEGALRQGASKPVHGAGDAGFALTQDYRAIEDHLDRAIEFWRSIDDKGAMAEAYFAKGWQAQNTARRHMGLQNWEQAENAYLAALAFSDEREYWSTRRRADIRFELAKLYLGWGTRFGDKALLEKAIHHFIAISAHPKRLVARRRAALGFLLAQAYLNCGGITNDRALHEAAIRQYNKLKSADRDEAHEAEIERGLAVAAARLALFDRERDEAKQAISLISSVIGQANGHWPPRDVLLRLRARLRELLFLLEGDDVALDRAINDRRELVAIASEGMRDLRWSVEVGDLVGLLSRRQYKLDGEQEDFHEAHYLLEKAIAICGAADAVENGADGARYNIPHIAAGLHLKLGKLLATFARLQFDASALNEAVSEFEQFLALTPRHGNPLGRAAVLNDIGQIMMDRSEHYGQHDGLWRAVHCFAEAHDIYLEATQMDQANRLRRFLENAEAAILAYQVPQEAQAAGDEGAAFEDPKLER